MVNTCHLHKWGKVGAFLCVSTEGTCWNKIESSHIRLNLKKLIMYYRGSLVAVNLLTYGINRTRSLVLRGRLIENARNQERSAIGV
jgi:hypothetical protein